MTSISTLIPDIQKLLTTKNWFTDELAEGFGHEVSKRLQVQFQERTEKPTLRLSQMGPRCPKALWHSIHTPAEAEPLPPWAELKFGFGHIIEAYAIVLAKAAGHEVTGEQDVVYVDGIAGHRDCVIDGCIVDVKSAASRSFLKFKNGSIAQDDSFGYLDQLDGYLVGSADDPLVTVKDRGYLFAIDKQLGHMCLYEHRLRRQNIIDRVHLYKDITNQEIPPTCTCRSIPDGTSGNMRLDLRASYNPFKYCCNPTLRTFLYGDGPRYLTKVVRRPKRSDGSLIPEIDRNGKVVYN